MSAIQEQIDNLYTLTQQGNGLLEALDNLIPIAEKAVLAEIAIGKTELVGALQEWGIDCSVNDSLSVLADKINPLVDNTIVIADDAPKPVDTSYIHCNPSIIIEVHDETVITMNDIALTNCKVLDCINVERLYVRNWGNLVECNVLNLPTITDYIFHNAVNIIDLTMGKGVITNLNFNAAKYNPTYAMSKTTSSLCYDSDLEKYGKVFYTNWEKWKYCIINHFAANLKDRSDSTTAFTITFGSVLANFDEEMVEAFTSKNWTLA